MAMHANGFDTKIRAYWSQPKKPILFTYQWEGMQCEYTVMTAKPIFDPEEDGPVPVAGVPTSKGSTPAIIFNRAPPERSKHGKSDLAMRTKELQAHKTVKSQHPRLAALGPHASEAPEVPSSGLFLHDSTAPDPAVDQQLDDTDGPLETVRWDASAQFQSSAHLQARDHQSRPEKHTENAARAVNSSTVIPKKRSRRLADSEDEWDDFGTGADNEDDSAYGARADDTQPLAYGGKLGASRADGQEAETDTAGFVVQGRTLEATQRLSQIKSIFDDFPDFE